MSTSIASAPPSACPVCGAPLPASAPHGLCPKCLLEGASAPTATGGGPADGRPGPPDLGRVAEAFPQLEILGLIGAGGMGAVFKARQRHLDRLVALKLLPEAMAANPAFAERFDREARVLARLNHPNIVTVYEFGRSGGFCYLLMELVDGVNLRQAMRAGRLSSAEALRIVPRICEALQFAHDEGVLHRDIKPENILLDARGRVKIADFGIAKLVRGSTPDATLTMSGAALGTPQYMAPEQIEHPREVDHRADLYSLGVVFYEMLTGELPIGRFAPPSEKTPLDRRIDDIVLRALAKERELRQQSATEIRTQVEGIAVVPGSASASRVAATRSPASARKPAPAEAGETVPGTSPVGMGGMVGGADDFILLNPRLPRMARAITVYAILLAPVLWLAGLLVASSEHKAFHGAAVWVQQLAAFLVGTLRPIAVVMLVVGGFKLRGLRPDALRWIRQGVWLHLGLVGLRLFAAAWVDALDRMAGTPTFTTAEIVFALVAIASIAWEISMLVWLGRHSGRLYPALGLAAPAEPAPHATAAAAWTAASLGLALVVTGIFLAAPQVAARQWNEPNPLYRLGSPVVLVVGAVVSGMGIAGWRLGRRALMELRQGQGVLAGVKRAVFGAAAWPALLAMGAAIVGGTVGILRLTVPGYVPVLTALLVSFVAGEALLRSAWREATGATRGRGGPAVPAWIRRWVLWAEVVAIAVFVPLTLFFL